VTKIGRAYGSFTNEEKLKQYWYHSDHLGSAQLITNVEGEEYERIEYTPYGELWVERASAASNIDIPYRFTGKERDEETGLYYYGARYLDPKTSRWLSTDPALSDYIPGAPINDETRKRNSNLPGMGGVFNTVNLHLYHYAGNNPIKYTDPDGRFTDPNIPINIAIQMTKEMLGTAIGGSAIKESVTAIISGLGFAALFCLSLQGSSVSSNNDRRDQSAIRFQLQTGHENITSNVQTSPSPTGVPKSQGYAGLSKLYNDASAIDPGLRNSKEFQSAIIKMSEKIKKSVGGFSQVGNVLREEFTYKNKLYRVDLENLRGTNLVE
jgi:RHS repeat-associated protein